LLVIQGPEDGERKKQKEDAAQLPDVTDKSLAKALGGGIQPASVAVDGARAPVPKLCRRAHPGRPQYVKDNVGLWDSDCVVAPSDDEDYSGNRHQPGGNAKCQREALILVKA